MSGDDKAKEGAEGDAKIKKINRIALIVAVLFVVPYTLHLRLAYGDWSFITGAFEGDIVTWIILAFVSVLLYIVYATFIYFRKHL